MQARCRLIDSSTNQTTHVNEHRPRAYHNRLRYWFKQHQYGTGPACAGCITGSLDEGAPRGTAVTIAGVDCYLSNPSKPNGNAVILAPDIFGHQLINTRLIADVFADNGYLAVVPDYFQSDPMDVRMLELSESLPQQSLMGKIGVGAQLAGQILGMAFWFPRHPVDDAVEIVAAVAEALRVDYGINKVGVQGYCYGGKVSVLMATKPTVVDAVCAAHPSILKVPDDIQAMKVPALFLCAETDAQFPQQKRSAAVQASQQTAPGRDRFILYKGTNHGFAVRGNRLDPAVSAARDDALQRGLKFFNRTLCGLTASEDQEAVSPGVVLSSSA